MSDFAITGLLIAALFLLLGTGVWIGLALIGVAFVGMELFTTRPVGDAMAVDDLGLVVELDPHRAAALHLDGRDPVPHAALGGHVPRASRPGWSACPGGCCTRTSSAARSSPPCPARRRPTCATIGKMTLPELAARGYPDDQGHRHARRRGHARPPDPAVDHHDRLRRLGRGVDRPPLHRRRHAGHRAGGAVHGLRDGLGAPQSRSGPGSDRARRPSRRSSTPRAT